MEKYFEAAQSAGVIFGYLGNIDPKFLAAKKELVVLGKDCHGVVKGNLEVFGNRLANPDQKTTIIMLHPDSRNIQAATDMDPHKTLVSQIDDCLKTIWRFQTKRQNLIAEGKPDCANYVTLAAYNSPPTQNIFLGDNEVIIKFYAPQPERGDMFGIRVTDKNLSEGANWLYNEAVRNYQRVLCGYTEERKDAEPIIVPPSRDVWNYKTPGWEAELRLGPDVK